MNYNLHQALEQQAKFARYEAVQDRRNAALARMGWCDVCREWVNNFAMAGHTKTQPHLEAERRYLAKRQ